MGRSCFPLRPTLASHSHRTVRCAATIPQAFQNEEVNAKGGVRTTYLDVRLYTYTIPNSGPGLCNQTGYQTRLPDAVLDKLYGNYGQYVSKVEHRLKELMDEGWFPKEYASDYVQKDLKAYRD